MDMEDRGGIGINGKVMVEVGSDGWYSVGYAG